MSWHISIILNQEKKKPTEDHEYDENEWSFKDDSEKIEWEEHYKSRSSMWGKDDEKDEELLRSKSGPKANVDVDLEDEI